MNINRKRMLTKMGLMTTLALFTGGLTWMRPAPAEAQNTLAQAETILSEQGSLAPMQDEYTFEGTAGQAVTIQLTSEDFDPVLRLLNASGEEIAFNDDFAGELNSTIVITLPAAGTYKVLAGSYSGQGGNYTLSVRPATPYEEAFGRATNLMLRQEFEAAIAAYDEAIALESDHPAAYIARADAYWASAYSELGESFTGPSSLNEQTLNAILTDLETAADLFEAEGQTDYAASLREQVTSIRAEASGGGE